MSRGKRKGGLEYINKMMEAHDSIGAQSEAAHVVMKYML